MRGRFWFWGALIGVGQALAAPMPAVQQWQLDNGLRLIVKEDHRAPVVLSSVWVQVGGSDEPKGLTGISHVLEHMMFRGTARYPSGQFDRLIASVGGQQNAETTNDYTMFYQLLPKEALALSFTLEADRMTNLVMQPDAFKREMQVVMEERRMRFENNPQALGYERYAATAFAKTPYQHQAIGWMADLQHMTVDDARRWYTTWYHPNNAIVVVVGDVHAPEVLALAQRTFGKLAKATVPTPVSAATAPTPPQGPKDVKLKLDTQLPMLVLGYQTPTFTSVGNQREVYALAVLAYLLGGANSSRLDNQLLRHDNLVTSVSATYDPFSRYAAMLEIVAIPTPSVTLAALTQAIQAQLQQLKQTPVSPAELARVKVQLLAGNVYRQDSLQAQAAQLGGAAVVGVPWQWAENFAQGVQQVTAADVQQVAKTYLVPAGLTTLQLMSSSSTKQKESHETAP